MSVYDNLNDFMHSVIVGNDDDCWIWKGSKSSSGYGITRSYKLKKEEGAHRTSWRLHCGDIPNGLHVLHTCDVRLCVNPNHLFLGTNMDNINDMNKKGRNQLIKLSENDVLRIRKFYGEGELSMHSLATLFKVCPMTIYNVVTRRTHKNIINNG